MAAWVGVDPQADIQWIDGMMQPECIPASAVIGMPASKRRRIRGANVANRSSCSCRAKSIRIWLSYAKSQDLRARKIGHVIMDMGRDKPFANCFCCMIVGHADFVRRYPVATEQRVRAILKATDLCSVKVAERAARRLVEGGFAQHYDTSHVRR